MFNDQISKEKGSPIHKKKLEKGAERDESEQSTSSIEKISSSSANDSLMNSKSGNAGTESKETDAGTEQHKRESTTTSKRKNQQSFGFSIEGITMRRKKRKESKRSLSVDLRSETESSSVFYLIEDREDEFEELEGYYLFLQQLKDSNESLKERRNYLLSTIRHLISIIEIKNPQFKEIKTMMEEFISGKIREINARNRYQKKPSIKKGGLESDHEDKQEGSVKIQELCQKSEKQDTSTTELQKSLEELKITISYKDKQIESLQKQRNFDRIQIAKYKSLFMMTKKELDNHKSWEKQDQRDISTETLIAGGSALNHASDHQNGLRMRGDQHRGHPGSPSTPIKSSKREFESIIKKVKAKHKQELEEVIEEYEKEISLLQAKRLDQMEQTARNRRLYQKCLKKLSEATIELQILKSEF